MIYSATEKTCHSVIVIPLPKCNSPTMIPARWEKTHKLCNLTYSWVYLMQQFQVSSVNFDHLLISSQENFMYFFGNGVTE